MTKEAFYYLLGRIENGRTLTNDGATKLISFTETLISIIEELADEYPDILGTEGWEHAIGWD